MEYQGNYTKNEYKKKIRAMSYEQLQKEAQQVSFQLIKGKRQMAMFQNPYGNKQEQGTSKQNMKLLRWMKSILIQQLLTTTKHNN